MADVDDLLRRVRDGDDGAFRDLVEATSRTLYRTALRMLGSTAEAQEVVQDAYLRAFEALRNGHWEAGTRGNAWLASIVTHGAIDALRRRKVRSRPLLDPDDGIVDGAAGERRVRLRELLRWLDELAPDQRAAVVLRHVDGMSNLDVARALGVSEGAIEQRLLRAKAALRKKMGDDTE